MCKGLQGDDPHYLKIAATLKHFAVNNVETDRQKLDAEVPERWLREYWLPHFRDAVVEGKAQSLMASYNAINGTPNNINHWLLTDLLRRNGVTRASWSPTSAACERWSRAMGQEDGLRGCGRAKRDGRLRFLRQGIRHSTFPAAVATGKITEARLERCRRAG